MFTFWNIKVDYMRDFMDITVGSQRLIDQAEAILPNLLELAESARHIDGDVKDARAPDAENLETRLLEAVGQGRRDEATEVLRIGRLSWRLRDDDNLLLSRIESQLYRASAVGIVSPHRPVGGDIAGIDHEGVFAVDAEAGVGAWITERYNNCLARLLVVVIFKGNRNKLRSNAGVKCQCPGSSQGKVLGAVGCAG